MGITSLIKCDSRVLIVLSYLMLTGLSLSSIQNTWAQSERGSVLQEPTDVPPPVNATNASATSLQDVNVTSPGPLVNQSMESIPDVPNATVESEPAQQEQNATEPGPITDYQPESEVPENETDGEQDSNNSSDTP
ncbi:MAG: hypothetical protein ACP5OH_00970 [Nitrososphaerota archaeon]